ncbi:MAG: flagellar filament capping protein FliD [Bacillota bacterium]|nr:flagellar filament capping protein FliD [Bacillota bacterium]
MAPLFSVSGLASGLDWRKIIDELMAVERRPITALQQRKTRLETVKQAWSDLKLALQAVDTKLDPFFVSTTFRARLAVSSAETVVTGSASAGAPTGTYAISVKTLAQAQVVASAPQSTGALGLAADSSFRVTVNGTTTTIDGIGPDDTVASIAQKVNDAGAGVTASVVNTVVDGVTKSVLVLKSKTTGKAGAMVLEDVNGGVLTQLEVLKPDGPNVVVEAQDATFTVDGVQVTSGSNTVTTAVPGVTLELRGTGSATLEVKVDLDAMVGKIKDFVKAYNDALAKLRGYLANSPGQSGPLGGDPTAQSVERQMRQLVYEAVPGLPATMDSLYDAGISTSGTTGELVIDESRLRQALSSQPDAVAALFYSSDAAVNSVAEKLRDAFRLWVQAGTGLIPSRLSGLEGQIKDMVDRIAVLEDRLKIREQRLIEQFVTLERSLSLLQSQGAWLEQRLAALLPQE